jgi:hypothetical protein
MTMARNLLSFPLMMPTGRRKKGNQKTVRHGSVFDRFSDQQFPIVSNDGSSKGNDEEKRQASDSGLLF